jgi:hypothetical protein
MGLANGGVVCVYVCVDQESRVGVVVEPAGDVSIAVLQDRSGNDNQDPGDATDLVASYWGAAIRSGIVKCMCLWR